MELKHYFLRRSIIKNILIVLYSLLIKSTNANNNGRICPAEISSCKIVEDSAVGNWFLMYGPRLGDHDLSTENSCGFFNTIRPCKCIGVNIDSEYSPPFVAKYTLYHYGYHERYDSFATSHLELNLISETHSIFNVFVPLANLNFTISITGTDNFESWISFTMCDELLDKDGKAGKEKLTWILSRSYRAERKVLETALYSANTNAGYLPSDYFIKVNHSDCPSDHHLNSRYIV